MNNFAFANAVAPELQGAPFYLIETEQLSRRFSQEIDSCGLLGATSRDMDLIFKGHVPWQGRGPGILLNNAAIERAAARRNVDPARIAQTIILHELGHVFEGPRPYFGSPSPTQHAVEPGAFRKAGNDCVAYEASNAPWKTHSPRWMRLALTLASRAYAQRLGFFPPKQLIGGYCAVDADRYALAMAPQISANQRGHVESLKALPLPPEVASVWMADMEQFRANNGLPPLIADAANPPYALRGLPMLPEPSDPRWPVSVHEIGQSRGAPTCGKVYIAAGTEIGPMCAA